MGKCVSSLGRNFKIIKICCETIKNVDIVASLPTVLQMASFYATKVVYVYILARFGTGPKETTERALELVHFLRTVFFLYTYSNISSRLV